MIVEKLEWKATVEKDFKISVTPEQLAVIAWYVFCLVTAL